MIKFFRKIRQKLLNKNKIGKYLLYAIGEIILVVIGILIALQINNWNEERKSADYTTLLFKKALEELKFNLEKANKVVAFYRGQDSLYYKVINKQVTKDDYKTSSRLVYLIMSGELVLLTDENFQKLISSEKPMTPEQDSLISNLKQLYSTSKAEVDIGDTLLPDFIFGLNKKYKDEKSWYAELINFGTNNEDMLNYFLSDPQYLNEVAYYRIAFLDIHLNAIDEFKIDALETYKELSAYLEVAIDTSLAKDFSDYTHYIGIYKDAQTTLHIEKEGDHLKGILTRNIDSAQVWDFNLYLESRTHFTTHPFFGKLVYNRNKEISDIVLTSRASQHRWEKVN